MEMVLSRLGDGLIFGFFNMDILGIKDSRCDYFLLMGNFFFFVYFVLFIL